MLEKLVVYFHDRGQWASHLDCRLRDRLVLTRYHQDRRLSLKPYPQLRRLSFSDAHHPLQIPSSVTWYIAVLRWREGRSRRRCHCCRRPCRSLLRFPQVSYYRYQPNISLSRSLVNEDNNQSPNNKRLSQAILSSPLKIIDRERNFSCEAILYYYEGKLQGRLCFQHEFIATPPKIFIEHAEIQRPQKILTGKIIQRIF